jgi:small GTP-binding protein
MINLIIPYLLTGHNLILINRGLYDMTEYAQTIYKICIVGDAAVGKTTILHRYIDGKFENDTMMTVGTNFFMKNIVLEDLGIEVKLQIWDLGGQEHFATVRPNFYAGAMGLIYTYDLTRHDTFVNLTNWKIEIENVVTKPVPSVLIGNKLDLIKHRSRIISSRALKKKLNELHADRSFFTSAKTGDSIDEVFRKLASAIYTRKKSVSNKSVI